MRKFPCLRGSASVRVRDGPPPNAVSAPWAKGPVATLVLKELSARRAPRIASHHRLSNFLYCVFGLLLLFDWDLALAHVTRILSIACSLLKSISPVKSSPLAFLLLLLASVAATAAVDLSPIRRTYEGVE